MLARCSRALRSAGVVKGDRVAGVMVNSQEALVCMLSVTAIGAIWSSCSPDFGVGGVSDRLGQISPKLVFFSLGYLYGGRWFDSRGLATDVLARLPGTWMRCGMRCGMVVSRTMLRSSCALVGCGKGWTDARPAQPGHLAFPRV
ncbi:unnamed protein product, partial [Hapterophycus canaliculatus]